MGIPVWYERGSGSVPAAADAASLTAQAPGHNPTDRHAPPQANAVGGPVRSDAARAALQAAKEAANLPQAPAPSPQTPVAQPQAMTTEENPASGEAAVTAAPMHFAWMASPGVLLLHPPGADREVMRFVHDLLVAAELFSASRQRDAQSVSVQRGEFQWPQVSAHASNPKLALNAWHSRHEGLQLLADETVFAQLSDWVDWPVTNLGDLRACMLDGAAKKQLWELLCQPR